jgi:hypothetical protein
MPTLRQQECRAALLRREGDHFEEELTSPLDCEGSAADSRIPNGTSQDWPAHPDCTKFTL